MRARHPLIIRAFQDDRNEDDRQRNQYHSTDQSLLELLLHGFPVRQQNCIFSMH